MVHSDRFLFAFLTLGLIGATLAAEDEKPRSIKGWGDVIDTAGDCSVKGDERWLTIEVPGGTHDLNPSLGGTDAPRVLKEVEGDFVVQVKVTGDFKPGEESASPDTSPFNGAGLLIWQNSRNFIRLERNAWWVRDAGAYACYPPLFEYHKDGQLQDTNPDGARDDFFKGRSTWLKLERREGKLSASYSHDGKEWTEVKQIDVELPRKVQVGVAAVNTSKKPLVVVFEELSVGL